jgi:hypothetical protein
VFSSSCKYFLFQTGEAEVEEKKNNKQNIGGSDADNDSDADSEQEAYFQVITI